jgi:hypothetical protein
MQHRILCALLDGATRNQIVEETGCSLSGLKAYIHALHKPVDGENLIYVSAWEKDKAGRCTIQVFKWGPGMKDVKQPLKKPNEVGADYRERVRLRNAQLALVGQR